MLAVRLVLLVVAFASGLAGAAAATDCRECNLGGAASRTRCIPNGGILQFNSVPPNVPAYWTLFAETSGVESLRRLDGQLDVFSDSPDPGVPGFPGQLEGDVYIGESAAFSGAVHKHRLRGVARYADGAVCEFRAEIAFGFGDPKPNHFVCRDGSGEVMSAGRVDVQGIRLRGCLRRRGQPYPRRSRPASLTNERSFGYRYPTRGSTSRHPGRRGEGLDAVPADA